LDLSQSASPQSVRAILVLSSSRPRAARTPSQHTGHIPRGDTCVENTCWPSLLYAVQIMMPKRYVLAGSMPQSSVYAMVQLYPPSRASRHWKTFRERHLSPSNRFESNDRASHRRIKFLGFCSTRYWSYMVDTQRTQEDQNPKNTRLPVLSASG
jgi:hypothetical protein